MIRNKDGIHIYRDSHLVLDSRSSKGKTNFVSHAHSDHSPRKGGEVVCSNLTAEILRKRFNTDIQPADQPNIQLLESGHILGSSAALIDGEVLYTGDVSTRNRAYLDGFKPVKAEELVIESTYGIPAYTFPEQIQIEKQIQDWIEDTSGTVFLFAYSLGKAQKIQYLVEEVAERPIYAHSAVIEMNNVIEEHTDLSFRAEDMENQDLENSIVIVPSHLSRSDKIRRLVDRYSVKKAGFSGWAVKNSYNYRGGYDKTFPFSDHCDFNELVELVESVDPEKVYTHHGFDEAFASYLRKEKGFNARALKNNQTSLTEF